MESSGILDRETEELGPEALWRYQRMSLYLFLGGISWLVGNYFFMVATLVRRIERNFLRTTSIQPEEVEHFSTVSLVCCGVVLPLLALIIGAFFALIPDSGISYQRRLLRGFSIVLLFLNLLLGGYLSMVYFEHPLE